MKVTVISIIIGELWTLPKGLEDVEIGKQVETIQTTALLRWTKILRRVLETSRELQFTKISMKTAS